MLPLYDYLVKKFKMGNRKSKNSSVIAKNLDDNELKNICNKTKMSPDEVLKWHSEFMVNLYTHFVLSLLD